MILIHLCCTKSNIHDVNLMAATCLCVSPKRINIQYKWQSQDGFLFRVCYFNSSLATALYRRQKTQCLHLLWVCVSKSDSEGSSLTLGHKNWLLIDSQDGV